MRNLLLALLLANLLTWAWHAWVTPDPVADPFALQGPRDPQLTLLPRGAAVIPGNAGETGAAARQRCVRLGPFDTGQDARRAGDRLRGLGLTVMESAEAGEIWVGHWVQVAGLPDRAAADAALGRLAQAGIRDAYIVGSDPEFRLSLGVFRSRDGADSVASAAGRAGFEPLITDRFRPGTEHWLTVVLGDSDPAEPARLAGGGAQILRSEAVDCPATLGAPGGD